MNLRKKKEYSPKFLLVLLTAICAVLLAVSCFFGDRVKPFTNIFSNVILPMQEGINSCGEWFGENIGSFKTVSELREENKILRERVELLAEENEIYKNSAQKVEELESTIKLTEDYEQYDTVAAKIISNGNGNWYKEFIINKGSEDGLAENMNVVAEGGLVGLVTDVSEHYAKVSSIINDKMSVSAVTKSTGDTCVVNGDFEQMQENNRITVSHIAKSAEVSAGDELVTSHISSKYLEGLAIGTITEMEDEADTLSQSGLVTPSVDFLHLEQVLVITQLKNVPDTSETAD